MVCASCGSPNPKNARVCKVCGTIVSDLRQSQIDYETAELPEAPKQEKPKSKRLSQISLVLGLVSLTPATFVTGIPAVICGAVALKQRRLGRRMAIAGVASGAFGTLVLTFAMFLPLMARQRELTRVVAVQRNMRAFQAAPEDTPGTIMILGWAPPEDRGSPMEYAVVGYGRDTTEPLTENNGRTFLALHN